MQKLSAESKRTHKGTLPAPVDPLAAPTRFPRSQRTVCAMFNALNAQDLTRQAVQRIELRALAKLRRALAAHAEM